RPPPPPPSFPTRRSSDLAARRSDSTSGRWARTRAPPRSPASPRRGPRSWCWPSPAPWWGWPVPSTGSAPSAGSPRASPGASASMRSPWLCCAVPPPCAAARPAPSPPAFLVLAIAGALVGLAGAVPVHGTERRLTAGVAGSIGFDAITVALLGRSGPVGIVLAGLLFAGLSTGGRFMESDQGVPLDLVQVIQVLVVLFIAAPPLVRTLIGLRRVDHPGGSARVRGARRARAAATAAQTSDVADAEATAATTGPATTGGPEISPAEPSAPEGPP